MASALDAIFFEASNTKSFENDIARDLFRKRWLGRYIEHDARWFYVASDDGQVAGYLAGSLDDPARTPRFSDVSYFAQFAELTRLYPGHLHINFAPDYRGAGRGGELIEQFAQDAALAGCPGIHVVTSRGARNVRFYERNGFVERGALGLGGKEIVFLARALAI